MKWLRRLVFLCLTVGLLAVTALGFSDLPDSHWAAADAKIMTEQGILRGYPDGTFRPDGVLSRAEFLAMCLRMTKNAKPISEQGGVDWWKPYWDAAEEWILPFDDTAVNEPISRGEMAAVLYAGFSDEVRGAAPLNLKDAFYTLKDVYFAVEDREGLQQLADYLTKWTGQNDQFIQRGMEWSVRQGFLAGYPDQTFRPEQSLTRAEAVKVLDRVFLQRSLWEQDARIILFSDDLCIYQKDNEQGTELISANLSLDGGYKVLSSLSVASVAENWSELRETLYRDFDLGMQVLAVDDKYFWGQCGFFSYTADGNLRQICDRPVIDYAWDADSNSFILVTHDIVTRPYLTLGGIYVPVGDQLMQSTLSGSMTMLLDSWTVNRLVFPNSEQEAKLLKVLSAEDGLVKVDAVYPMGMTDLQHHTLRLLDGEPITAEPREPNTDLQNGYWSN